MESAKYLKAVQHQQPKPTTTCLQDSTSLDLQLVGLLQSAIKVINIPAPTTLLFLTQATPFPSACKFLSSPPVSMPVHLLSTPQLILIST